MQHFKRSAWKQNVFATWLLLLKGGLYFGLALIGQDLQGLKVGQALVVIKENAVVSCGRAQRLVAEACTLLFLGFPQHLKNQSHVRTSAQWGHLGKTTETSLNPHSFSSGWETFFFTFLWVQIILWLQTWLRDAVFSIRVLVFLKPGSLSARTFMVFFPMNSRASSPPLMTDLPLKTEGKVH